MTLNEWASAALNHQFGNYIDVDGYYQGQCWDLAAHYAREVVGCPSLPTGSGGAEGVYRLFQNPIPQYFDKVANNPNDPNQLPPAGALIVYGPVAGNPYGHIEVVMGANTAGVDVVYQDGFNPTQGPLRKFRKWGSLPCMGWLVPKTQAKPNLQGYQRIVGDGGVNRRSQPNTNVPAIETFAKGEVLDFGGWIFGQTVDNNNVWFKGRYSDTYFWSGAFTDAGKHDLTDLNPVAPAPVTNPNQRTVVDGGLNVRAEATTLAQIVKVLPAGSTVVVSGYNRTGATVEGNSLWFRTQDGWVWAGGLSNQSTDGLTDQTPAAPTTPPAPTYPANTTDPLVTKVYNKKHPVGKDYAPTDLVSAGNGQQLRKEAFASLQMMQDAGANLTSGSGYRSYATQETLYANYVKQDGQAKADTYSARAGYSEHQTGLTMDFTPIDEVFENSAQFKWLTENGYKYGWVLRYPSDKVVVTGYMYEPWHWRYVGVEVATAMHTQGIKTLEEYFKVEGGLYPDQEIPSTPTTPTTPSEPTTPEVPTTPAPTDEASKSALAFVARVTSQVAAAGIIVNGMAGLLKSYASLTFDAQILGIATVVLAVAMIGYSQFKYKKSGGTKGWFF